MANLKVRGVRESIEDKGPQDGPAMSMDVGAESIRNTPMESVAQRDPSFRGRTQPNSSLGARQHPAPIYGKKA